MDCVSLERYLEAYLEGRLRRAQWLVLRRHVMTCQHCRARVEQLRQFEVDLHQRFRSMARTQRLWTGLELDLVGLPSTAASGETLPPKPPRPAMTSMSSALLLPPAKSIGTALVARQDTPAREQRWPMMALVCLVMASIGTGAWLLVQPTLDPADEINARGLLKGLGEAEAVAVPEPPRLSAAPAAATGALHDTDVFETASVQVAAGEVPDWLETRLGRRIDLALPDDVTILGGSELILGANPQLAVLVLSPGDGRLMILPTVAGMKSASADVLAFARRNGLAHVIRRQDGVTVDVLGAVTPGRLEELFQTRASASG